MRLPRHDTPLSLPAEQPREALARDEALLDEIGPGEDFLERWWVAAAPAIVVGLGLWHRLESLVDVERCRRSGIEVVERRAGGGAVLVDEHMLCGAICLPVASVPSDVTESYRWLGDRLACMVRDMGALDARRVEVGEARADVARLRDSDDVVARLLLATCYGALSPHEVVVGGAKMVGLAQVRRRHAALFQFGILRRDQSPLADYLVVPSADAREELRAELQRRTIGLDQSVSRHADQLA